MRAFICLFENFKLMSDERTPVCTIEDYVVEFSFKNYVVYERKTPTDVSFFIDLAGALKNISQRILERKFKSKSAEESLKNIKELILMCKEHNENLEKIAALSLKNVPEKAAIDPGDLLA